MRIVCLSDTHNHEIKDVPLGDVLIHAGDFTNSGTLGEVNEFARWFKALPHVYKIVVAGNHDFSCQQWPSLAREALGENVHYLDNQSVTIDGIEFYGSPVTPRYGSWAFMQERNSYELYRTWELIPESTQVLITHGPAFGVLDNYEHRSVGCELLAARVEKLPNLRLHVCGHIHEAAGITKSISPITINAAVCNAHYQPVNQIQFIDL